MDPELLRAIKEFLVPASKTDVRSFFGLVNHLSSQTDQLSTLLMPLQPLFKKDNVFVWDSNHQTAFDTVRTELTTDPLFVSYHDLSKRTRLHTDASRLFGIGFILRQLQPDYTWRMIQSESRSLL